MRGEALKRIALRNAARAVMSVCVVLGCASAHEEFSYDFLPRSRLHYYMPEETYDLRGTAYAITITSSKAFEGKIACSKEEFSRRDDLYSARAAEYMMAYLRAMIVSSNGVYDPNSADTISIDVSSFAAKKIGFAYFLVFAFVEFTAETQGFEQSYCMEMGEEDERSPAKGFHLVWSSKTTKRQVASACLGVLFNDLVRDLAEGLSAGASDAKGPTPKD